MVKMFCFLGFYRHNAVENAEENTNGCSQTLQNIKNSIILYEKG